MEEKEKTLSMDEKTAEEVKLSIQSFRGRPYTRHQMNDCCEECSPYCDRCGFIGPPGPMGPMGLMGATGATGPVSGGTVGATGPTGPAGSTVVWYNGAGQPDPSLGKIGDQYLDIDSGDIYSKASGIWLLVTNIKGPSGPAVSQSALYSNINGVQTVATDQPITFDEWNAAGTGISSADGRTFTLQQGKYLLVWDVLITATASTEDYVVTLVQPGIREFAQSGIRQLNTGENALIAGNGAISVQTSLSLQLRNHSVNSFDIQPAVGTGGRSFGASLSIVQIDTVG